MPQDLSTRVPKYWIPRAAGSPRNLEKGVARYGNPEHAPAPWLPPTKGSPATRTPQPGERVRPDSKPLRRRPLDSLPPRPPSNESQRLDPHPRRPPRARPPGRGHVPRSLLPERPSDLPGDKERRARPLPPPPPASHQPRRSQRAPGAAIFSPT